MNNSLKLITFSLWGKNPKYLVGAIKNAELASKIYPGWKTKYYVGSSVERSVLNRLKDLGAIVVEKGESGDYGTGLFWRFLDASNPECEVMISRDCDSRLNYREASAVREWLDSGLPFHIMRDHPYHNERILGGMWGIRGGFLPDLSNMITSTNFKNEWGSDQIFLREKIYPLVKNFAFVHDEFFDSRPFPLPRKGMEYVGQVFDQWDKTINSGKDFFVRYPKIWKASYKIWNAIKS